jgi:hypothetical protein
LLGGAVAHLCGVLFCEPAEVLVERSGVLGPHCCLPPLLLPNGLPPADNENLERLKRRRQLRRQHLVASCQRTCEAV